MRGVFHVKLFALVGLTALSLVALVAALSFEWGDWLTLCAAIPAGIGGALLGDRGMAWWLEHHARGR